MCLRCRTPLEHCRGQSVDAALACSIAILLLLIPAFCAPFLTTATLGATRTSILPQSVTFLWAEGWPLLAVTIGLVVLVFPVIRFGALVAVLSMVRRGKRAPWLGPAFRLSDALQTWAMLDVFLLGLVVAFARLHSSLQVSLHRGTACFVLAALLALFVRASLDKAEVWRAIRPDSTPPSTRGLLACGSCGLLADVARHGARCERCGATLRRRKAHSLMRATALLATAILLYFPANLYPIATIPIDLKPTAYTVLGGVHELLESQLLGLAVLVFTASFTIPILKMLALTWCAHSALRHSTRHLVAKTRVYRLVEEIGRWSMVDPLTIACFVPVLHFNGLFDGRAEAAATPFALVVVLTTFAVSTFDPRLMWDPVRPPA